MIDGRPVFVESRQEQAFQDAARAAGITPRKVTQVSGHNYNGDDEVLTLYRNPSQSAVADQ